MKVSHSVPIPLNNDAGLPRDISSNYNEDSMISAEKMVDFNCKKWAKYCITWIIIVVFGCICFITCKELLLNNKVQMGLLHQLGNSLAAILVSLATFFGLKRR